MKTLIINGIKLCLLTQLSYAIFPQDLSVTQNCMSCVLQQGQIFNVNLNSCGATSADCEIDRCCNTVGCCVNDGCRSPTEFFAYDALGEFTTRCETCCDSLQTPDFDEMQYFLKTLILDRCDSTTQTNSSGVDCQMTLAFTDQSLGFVTFDVKQAQVLDTITGLLLPGVNVSAEFFDEDGKFSDGKWIAELFSSYNSSLNPNACPSALNFYAKQLYALGKYGSNANYSFVQSETSHCSYFSQSLIYKYSTIWLDLSVISESKLKKTQISDFSTIPKVLENDFPKYCQYRYFRNESDVTEPYYNMISQSPCVDTYQYPPSCPKCALCSKHDEELLLSQDTLSTDQLNDLLTKCPHIMASTKQRLR
jgi:hypothetical protein